MSHTAATVLIVEDEKQILSAMRYILQQAGYCVVTAENGNEALTMMQETTPDVILADIAMPHLNGYQLFERVRQNPAWALIPFIFLTGRSLDSDIRYGKTMGADDYLTKPIDPEDLLAVIRGKVQRVQQIRGYISQLSAQRDGDVASDTHIAAPSGTGVPTTEPCRPGPDALVIDRLVIDPDQRRVWLDERRIALSATEFALLEALALRANQVVTPQELVQVTHGLTTDTVAAGNLIRPLIRTLRRKLGFPVGDLGCIETVRGAGYRLVGAGPATAPADAVHS